MSMTPKKEQGKDKMNNIKKKQKYIKKQRKDEKILN